MKRILLYFISALLLFNLCNCRIKAETVSNILIVAQDDKEDKAIKSMIKSFYTEYILQCSKRSDTDNYERDLEAIKNKYCTQSLVKDIKEAYKNSVQDGYIVTFNWDIFTMAQDCFEEMLDSMIVEKDDEEDNVYFVAKKGTFNAKEKSHGPNYVIIRLRVAKENGENKICDILEPTWREAPYGKSPNRERILKKIGE